MEDPDYISNVLRNVNLHSRYTEWWAECPLHQHNGVPKLLITYDYENDIVIRCTGDCETRDVLWALGLQPHELRHRGSKYPPQKFSIAGKKPDNKEDDQRYNCPPHWKEMYENHDEPY
jgi:hypothetical protein